MTQQQQDGAPPEIAYGMEAAMGVMAGGGLYPRLRLKNMERARFHALTTGADANFLAATFHTFGVFPNSRSLVCVRVLTGGQQECRYCVEGHSDLERRFGLWVWCYEVLHSTDNPDQEGTAWAQVKVADRTLFKEPVGKALLLDLKGGKGGLWFRQFLNEWLNEGTLQKYLYELHREGESLDTEYTLARVKEEPPVATILESEEVKRLRPIHEIFKAGLQIAPGGAGDAVLGKDELQQTEIEELPAAVPVMGSGGDELI